jgi:hypothetical protein
MIWRFDALRPQPRVRVFLDGEPVAAAVMADDEEGLVYCLAMKDGRCYKDERRQWEMERRRGQVRIDMSEEDGQSRNLT